jgi:hypothetical protein
LDEEADVSEVLESIERNKKPKNAATSTIRSASNGTRKRIRVKKIALVKAFPK